MVVLHVHSRISIITGVQGRALEASCPFGEVLCAQKCLWEDGVAKHYAIWEVHLYAEQISDVTKGRERQSSFCELQNLLWTVTSKLLSLVAQSELGFIPQSLHMRSSRFLVLLKQQGSLNRAVLRLCAFGWLFQKWTRAILLCSFLPLATNGEKWHCATLCLVRKSSLIWNSFRIGKASKNIRKNSQRLWQ